MASEAQEILSGALASLVRPDVAVACAMCIADDEADLLKEELETLVRDTLRNHPEPVDALIPALEAAHHLERIVDHATNIAENVIYMEEGLIVRHLLDDSPKEPRSNLRRRENFAPYCTSA